MKEAMKRRGKSVKEGVERREKDSEERKGEYGRVRTGHRKRSRVCVTKGWAKRNETKGRNSVSVNE